MDVVIKEDHSVTSIADHETTCWGCGLRLLLPSYTPIFKCGWCGAITNQNPHKHESQYLLWRHFRDRFFVSILLLFMVFVICGGIWAVYPLLFSISYFCGVSHCIITIILSLSTISCFSLAAFCCAGPPPSILWGSYPLVGKGGLENYTFCSYCSKPKSPRTHHCRSCGTCILDMDHHCPFIGNCVGASNHRSFIAFLISAVISTMYASIMSAYVGFQIWPSVDYGSVRRVISFNSSSGYKVLLEIAVAFLNSAVFLSTRGLVLVYLFIASLTVKLGLCVLLWQQLHYIYKGKTYLSHLASQTDNDDEEKGCHNIFRFFGCHTAPLRMLPRFSNTKKNHKKGT